MLIIPLRRAKIKIYCFKKQSWEKESNFKRKERGVDEEAAPFIYEVISVRFKFKCQSLLSAKKNLFFLFNFLRNQCQGMKFTGTLAIDTRQTFI